MSSSTFKSLTKLQGARVLVIGGTSGIGFAVAESCLEYGATVIVAGSNQDRLDKTVSRLRTAVANNPSPLILEPKDLSKLVLGKTCNLKDVPNVEANIQGLLAFATDSAAHQLDHVVFTAGDHLGLRPLSEISTSFFHESDQAASSSYTLTGGINAWRPSPNFSVYASFGLQTEGLVHGLAVDMTPVRVNCVRPGAIVTELWDGFGDAKEGMKEMYKKRTLTGTVGKPEECAESYLHMMKNSFATGTVVTCDGGQMIKAA
ncbi:hypothetical protein MKZ38_008130 [Zalerion maritima]|uniref:NAD(P)-binding protein n=1 Tax=Zalerion maritima TaxID=339359 RepID=A0AAD5RHW6_9PEZI|nr:hypothetical protein MKZ38_008130 [Zalerion maritima]